MEDREGAEEALPRNPQPKFLKGVIRFSDMLARGAGSAAELLGDAALRTCANAPVGVCSAHTRGVRRPSVALRAGCGGCRKASTLVARQAGAQYQRFKGLQQGVRVLLTLLSLKPLISCILPDKVPCCTCTHCLDWWRVSGCQRYCGRRVTPPYARERSTKIGGRRVEAHSVPVACPPSSRRPGLPASTESQNAQPALSCVTARRWHAQPADRRTWTASRRGLAPGASPDTPLA